MCSASWKILLSILGYGLMTLSFATPLPVKAPPGWPQTISMGSVINGGTETGQFIARPVLAAFTYAGQDGGGDRGELIRRDAKVDRIMAQIRSIESQIGKTMMPSFVFYTVNGSNGTDSIKADLEPGNLTLHYQNLIYLLKQLQSYKDSRHPVPATLILNPDFLGELQKQCQKYYCPIPLDMAIPIRSALVTALESVGFPVVNVPVYLLTENQSFAGYVASINWLMHTFGPNIVFGWQENVWAGDETGHAWIHQATTNPKLIDQHVDSMVQFLHELGVFSTQAERQAYNPHFLAFDKYERDVFTCTAPGVACNTFSNTGYLYNAQDMDVYLNLVKGVSQKMGNVPIMLWQIPGGHLQTTDVRDQDKRQNHASAEADYILGNPYLSIDLVNMRIYYKNLAINPTLYNSSKTSVHDYLTLCPAFSPLNCLQTGHLDQLQQANVFAVLWGGGSTTGVSGLSTNLDDGGWLYSRIHALGLY